MEKSLLLSFFFKWSCVSIDHTASLSVKKISYIRNKSDKNDIKTVKLI